MGKLDQVFLKWNMRHRGKVDAPFLSLATHSVCRRGRCSHPSKTTSGSKIRTNVVQETFGHIRLHFQFIFMALSSKTQLPSSWSSKFTHAGVVSGSILVGMRREKSEKVARGPLVDHHQPTAALCKQLIYAHILCIAGLDYSRRSPGWIIPIHNRAGRFPQITSQDYQAGLFPIEYVTSYFVLETTYLIFVTGTTGCACGEKVCDEEKFKIFMWRNPAT